MGCGVTAHAYGFQRDGDQLVTGPCSVQAGHATCALPASNQCHGEFLCVACLSHHVSETGAEFVGELPREEVGDDDA